MEGIYALLFDLVPPGAPKTGPAVDHDDALLRGRVDVYIIYDNNELFRGQKTCIYCQNFLICISTACNRFQLSNAASVFK
jgi:hypothetical protein